ncbi:MAG: GTPase HflX [Candidatus Cloacimonadota bacterium]|nr:MAG: GTPase HflX [Candidatus Cloacimonadota bacterium]
MTKNLFNKKVLVVGIVSREEPLSILEDSLAELAQLLDTLSFETVGSVIQHKEVKSPRTLIGKGKVESLKNAVKEYGVCRVVFDEDLSPTQARNLKKELDVDIIDRCGIILEIFTQHAKTHEAKVQIDLARQEYSLSHLRRQWTHLSRQQGGQGIRGGEGETQLEVDRRLARSQIQTLKKKLKKIKAQRETRNKNRSKFFKVAIVGYTNSGKSTLLNQLTGSDVLVQNKLFATLDPSTRIIKPDEKPSILFTDTVGFIKKLPHNLVASFRSTFEVIQDADLLLHVVDISDPDANQRILDTVNVIKDLHLDHIPRKLVLNKIDLKEDKPQELKLIQSVYEDAVLISAHANLGIDKLNKSVYKFFESQISEIEVEIPYGKEKCLDKIYDLTKVLSVDYCEDKIIVHFRGATRDVNYIVNLLK